MIATIKKRIQAVREAKAIEEERASYVRVVQRKRMEYRGACRMYDTIMAESKDSALIEIAYDHMKLKECELEFVLAQAKKSNIRAYWDDFKIS